MEKITTLRMFPSTLEIFTEEHNYMLQLDDIRGIYTKEEFKEVLRDSFCFNEAAEERIISTLDTYEIFID